MAQKAAAQDLKTAIRQDWRSVNALVERINEGARKPTMTSFGLRHYIAHADANGLRPHIRRLGRKILISESGFYEWLNNQAVA